MIRTFSDFVFLIGIICLLFITQVTSTFLGIKQGSTFSNIIIFLMSTNFVLRNWKIINYNINKTVLFYFFIVLIISFNIIINYDFLDSLNFLKSWFTPALILLYFENINSNKRRILKKILLLFFILECILALYERYTTTLIFGNLEILGLTEYQDEKLENLNTIFRAQSLLGNPLTNAHLVCIMVGIILNSSLRLNYIYIYFIIGILSVLCFNARAATLSLFFVVPIFFFKIKNKLNNNQMNSLLFLFIGGLLSITYIMFNSNLGGRLVFGNKLLDESASARFQALDIFWKFYNTGNPFLGNYKVDNFKLTENGYINLMIKFGIPFAFLFILSQIFLIFSRLKIYDNKGKSIILICFFIVGFSNNNLALPDCLNMLCIWLSAFSKNV